MLDGGQGEGQGLGVDGVQPFRLDGFGRAGAVQSDGGPPRADTDENASRLGRRDSYSVLRIA